MRNFAELGVLRAVADVDADTATTIGAKYKVAPRTLEGILSDPEIDAVAVATPAVTHAEIAIQALQAGQTCVRGKASCVDAS